MDEDVRRVEFVLDEKELNLERDESATLFEDLDTSIDGISENPINLLLASFDNDYMKNERIGIVLFEALNDSLRRYTKLVNDNYYYQDMEIINNINLLLTNYNTWITNQRGLILSTREKIKEIRKLVEKEYITKRALDNSREEMKLQLAEIEKEANREGVVAVIGKINGVKTIQLPENCELKEGDIVSIKEKK